jgi:hypothetical protein
MVRHSQSVYVPNEWQTFRRRLFCFLTEMFARIDESVDESSANLDEDESSMGT